MECQDVKERLSAYQEGVLPADEEALVHQHLLSCKQCSALLDELKATHDLLKNLEEVEPPPWLKQKIMARVKEEAEQRRTLFRKLFYPFHIKIPVQVLGVFLVAVLLFQVYQEMEPTVKPSAVSPPPSAVTRKDALEQKAPEGAAKPEISIGTRSTQLAPTMESAVPKQASEGGLVAEGGKPIAETRAVLPPASELAKKEKVLLEDAEQDLSRARVAGATKPAEAPAAVNTPSDKEQANELFFQEAKIEPSPPADEQQAAAIGGAAIASFIIDTEDVLAAQHTVEEILRQLGGKEIEAIAEGSNRVILVSLPFEKTEELAQQLQTVGDIRQPLPVPGRAEETVRIRIELIPQTPQ